MQMQDIPTSPVSRVARTENLYCTALVSFASITMLGLTCQLMICAQIYVANMFFVIRHFKSQLQEWKKRNDNFGRNYTKKNSTIIE